MFGPVDELALVEQNFQLDLRQFKTGKSNQNH